MTWLTLLKNILTRRKAERSAEYEQARARLAASFSKVDQRAHEGKRARGELDAASARLKIASKHAIQRFQMKERVAKP